MYALLHFSFHSFSCEFGNLLIYFWGNDFCFFLLLIKFFGHFDLSILKISSYYKREFLVNAENLVLFPSVLLFVEQMRHYISVGEASSSFVLFLVAVKYRAEISLKRDTLRMSDRNFFFLFFLEFFDFMESNRGSLYFCLLECLLCEG